MHCQLTPELEVLVKEILRTKKFNNRSEVMRHALRFTYCQNVQVPPGYRVQLVPINGHEISTDATIKVKRRGRVPGLKDGADLQALRLATYGPPKQQAA